MKMNNVLIDEINEQNKMDKEDQKQSIFEMLMEADNQIFNQITK
jgi:hypothetical protein